MTASLLYAYGCEFVDVDEHDVAFVRRECANVSKRRETRDILPRQRKKGEQIPN